MVSFVGSGEGGVDQKPQQRVGVLGGQDFIYSQKSGVEHHLFKGEILGMDADVASGDFRFNEFRTFSNIQAKDWHVPERFSSKVALHVAKNVLMEKLHNVQV